MMAEEEKTQPARHKKLQTSKYEFKNIKFLGDFMTTLGLTTTTAAEKCGLTQVSVYYWLRKDDAHYSSVERLINAWGYKLKMELVSPDDHETSIVVIDKPDERRLAFFGTSDRRSRQGRDPETTRPLPSESPKWFRSQHQFVAV